MHISSKHSLRNIHHGINNMNVSLLQCCNIIKVVIECTLSCYFFFSDLNHICPSSADTAAESDSLFINTLSAYLGAGHGGSSMSRVFQP